MIDTQAIINVFAQEAALDPAGLTPDTVLKELGITSLDMMNVLFSIEEATGVILETDELETITTLGELVHLIESKATAPEGQPS